MVEDEDLEVLRALVPATMVTADEETHEGADDEVEERPHRPIVPGLSERESGFPTPTGWPVSLASSDYIAGCASDGHDRVDPHHLHVVADAIGSGSRGGSRRILSKPPAASWYAPVGRSDLPAIEAVPDRGSVRRRP